MQNRDYRGKTIGLLRLSSSQAKVRVPEMRSSGDGLPDGVAPVL